MTDLVVTDSPSDTDCAALVAGIAQADIAKGAPPFISRKLGVFLRDDHDTVTAGLDGMTFWNWLYIDRLWVSEKLRGQGLGTRLIDHAEREAIQRGCHSAYLWTQSYEAPDFYKKLGYQQFVMFADCPRGYQHYGFMKRLAA